MSSKNKHILRRKSQVLDSRTQVASSEQAYCHENDELKQLYQNKDYQPPEIKRFETIYELSSKVRRGLIEEDGTLKVGRGLGHRFIDFAAIEYWRCDDKERNKKRKGMVTKQFKGRKRNKSEPLSDKAYDELFEMIANKEDSITESDSEQNKEVDCLNVSILDLPVEMKTSNVSFPETDLLQEDSNRKYVDNSKLDKLEISSASKIYSVEPLCKSSDTSLSSSTVTKLHECLPSTHLCTTTFNLSCSARDSSSSTKGIRPEEQNKMLLSARGSYCVRRSARIKSKSEGTYARLFIAKYTVLHLFIAEEVELDQGRKNGQGETSANELDVLGSILVEGVLPDKRKRFRKDFPSIGDCDVFKSRQVIDGEKTSTRLFSKEDSNDKITNSKTVAMDRIDQHLDIADTVESKECHNSDTVFADEEIIGTLNKGKRRSITYKDLSFGLGVNSGRVGNDISMPAVARRSLSGEMVPRRSGEFGVCLISTQDDA